MDDLERQRWAHLIDGLVKGEYVELLCRDVRAAKNAQNDCIRLLEEIELPYEARRSVSDMWVRVCGMIRFLPYTNPNVHVRGCRPSVRPTTEEMLGRDDGR